MSLSSWFCALRVENCDNAKQKKLWLLLNCAVDILLIGYFKYAGLFCSIFGNVPEFIRNIALPIGISFYTFQLLTYVVDVYRGEVQAQKYMPRPPITLWPRWKAQAPVLPVCPPPPLSASW